MWLAQRCRLVSATLGVFALASLPLPASAQSDSQRGAARSLATEGAKAFGEGHYAEAADLFSKAETLLHAPPHLLFLARSAAKLGQYVRAQEAYLKIIKETLPSSAPKAFRDAQESASTELREVEPKIASLTVTVTNADAATDLAVKVDNVVLPAVLLGVPQPIDPGTHQIEAGATGFRAVPQSVTLGDAERKSVTLALESAPGAAPLVAPAVAPVAAVAPAPAPAAPPPPSAPPAEQRDGSSKSGLRIGSYVGFGVGALGLIGGTVFTLQSASKRKDADKAFEECGGAAGCTQNNPLSAKVDDLDGSARSAKTLGIVGFALGGVGVAAGVTLLVLSSGGDEQHASVEPWLGPGSAGLRGKF